MMSFSYAVVIVTYNRIKLLKECIEHIVNQTFRPTNIVIIDNCCTDGSKEFLNEMSKTIPEMIVEHEKENLGGAGGFNRGIRLAVEESKADWIMIIDDDAILDYTCMEKMNPSQLGMSAKAYACKVMCDGIIDLSHRRNIHSIPSEENYAKETFKCELATFCGLMIHRQLIEKIGYPQAEYFIWFDDTEYCMRIGKYSDIIVLPKAFLVHKTKPETSIGNSGELSWKSYYGQRNLIDAYKKHRMWKRLLLQIAHAVKEIIVLGKKDKLATTLMIDALKDGIMGRLGKNIKYLPGKK